MRLQPISLFFYTFIDEDGGPGIILLNEIENFVSVFDGEHGPLNLQDSFFAALCKTLRRAA